MNSTGNSIIILIFGVVALLIYLLPSIIAFNKHKRSAVLICLLNIFVGWSFVGWVIMLIWASSND